MIRLIIIFWNVLFSVAPSSQPETQYVNPLHGYHLQAKSVDVDSPAFSQLKNDISSDSDDTEDSDDETKDAACINKIQRTLTEMRRSQKVKVRYEYFSELSQGHITPIVPPPDI